MKFDPVWQWKERHPKLFEIAVAVVLGLMVEIALVAFQPPTLTVVRKSADEAADTMIRISDQLGGVAARSPGYAMIDIDDATWDQWGRRVVTPRDRIARLIDYAASSNPLAIVVDIDLSYRDDPQAEKSLSDFLQTYPAAAPPLILVRSLDQPAVRPRAPAEQRPTVFDAATREKPNIAFAAPLFERDKDGQVRRWRLFAQSCISGRPAVLPATHVSAAVLAREALARGAAAVAPAPAWNELAKRLAAFSPGDCTAERIVERGTLADRTPAAPPIEVEQADASTRVLYRIGWRSDASTLGLRTDAAGAESPLVSIRPARLVEAASGAPAASWLAGRIVVIGGSFASSGDWYQTPLGRMPGALVLINAIEGLTVNGTPTEPDLATRTLISFAIIIVAAVAAAWLKPLVAGMLTAGFVLLVMLASLKTFQSGVVVDLAIPAVGAAIHDLVATLARIAKELRQEGFKWFLKKPEKKPAPPVSEPVAAAPPIEGSSP